METGGFGSLRGKLFGSGVAGGEVAEGSGEEDLDAGLLELEPGEIGRCGLSKVPPGPRNVDSNAPTSACIAAASATIDSLSTGACSGISVTGGGGIKPWRRTTGVVTEAALDELAAAAGSGGGRCGVALSVAFLSFR